MALQRTMGCCSSGARATATSGCLTCRRLPAQSGTGGRRVLGRTIRSVWCAKIAVQGMLLPLLSKWPGGQTEEPRSSEQLGVSVWAATEVPPSRGLGALTLLTEASLGTPQRGLCFLPKAALDTRKAEVMRMLKLENNQVSSPRKA